MRFNDLFNHYDTKCRGELGIHELKHLVREIMPKVTDAQIWLFQVGRRGKDISSARGDPGRARAEVWTAYSRAPTFPIENGNPFPTIGYARPHPAPSDHPG